MDLTSPDKKLKETNKTFTKFLNKAILKIIMSSENK